MRGTSCLSLLLAAAVVSIIAACSRGKTSSSIDSDHDSISDVDEGRAAGRDADVDGIPDYLDLDSDGDCIPDAAEAGDADVSTPPVDSDGDGVPDAYALDSDGDLLPDRLEDGDCNGVTGPLETDRVVADTDGDGATDLVEVAVGTDARSPADNPGARGWTVFVVPQGAAPQPPTATVGVAVALQKVDLLFLLDATGSMSGELANLKASFSSILATAATLPDPAAGVAEYEDFPMTPYGDAPSGDQPFVLRQRMMTFRTSQGSASALTALNAVVVKNGGDTPEAGWEALGQSMTGVGVTAGTANVAPFDPATAPPLTIPAGEVVGTSGGIGFREGALPLVLWSTDSHNHNSSSFPADVYSFGGAFTDTSALAAAGTLHARVMTVLSDDLDLTAARTDARVAATRTDARVFPDAWGTAATRPAGCAVGQCCTGINGVGVVVDSAGLCPLVADISNSGSGMEPAIDSLIGIATTHLAFHPDPLAVDDPADAVDATTFVTSLVLTSAGGGSCSSSPSAIIPGETGCIVVAPKINAAVAPGPAPISFPLALHLREGNVELGSSPVFFVIPPAP